MKYSVATNWDNVLLDKIILLNKDGNDCVGEFFGSLNVFTAVSSFEISRIEVEEFINRAKKSDIKFNYLFNTALTESSNNEFVSVAQWVNELGVDMVTVANEENLAFLQEKFPLLPINISIIAGLDTYEKVENMVGRYSNIKRVTLKQGINRDKILLLKIINYLHKKNIEVELLANELCLVDCASMKEHYLFSSKNVSGKNKLDNQFDNFCQVCNHTRSTDFINFLNAAWIRPEDIVLYEGLGVDIVKIAGKTEKTEYLCDTVGAYMKKKYAGNIMDLFSSDWWLEKKVPNINNAALDGFVEYLWSKNLKKIARKNLPSRYNLNY